MGIWGSFGQINNSICLIVVGCMVTFADVRYSDVHIFFGRHSCNLIHSCVWRGGGIFHGSGLQKLNSIYDFAS